MAQTSYPYSVSADTAVPAGPPENGLINGAQLRQAIEDSSMSAPAISDYLGPNQSGDVLGIVFANAISAGDKTLLDAVMLAHPGTVTFDDPKRVRMDPFNDPLTQDDATFTTKLQLVCPPVKKGVWALSIRGELALNPAADFSGGGADSAADMIVLIDGVERVMWVTAFSDFDNKAVSDDLDLAEAATPDIEIQIRRRSATARDAELRRAVISMVFVGGEES